MCSKLIDFPSDRRQTIPGVAAFDPEVIFSAIVEILDRTALNRCLDAASTPEGDPSPTVGGRALLPEIEEALFEAHKMEILGQMAGGLAHNFNNLLQGVMSSMSLMQGRACPTAARDFDFLIGHAAASVNRVGALTKRLFAFARPYPLDGEVVEVNSAIEGMRDLLQCAMLPGYRLNIALDDRPISTLCDPRQLEVTMLDLVLNARDAMPKGGVLTIKTGPADLQTNQARLPLGRYVSICVDDTGLGMTAESLAQAFDPFYTTKSTGRRTGLGLPIAKLFIERFHGYIAIDSSVGAGTSVRLYLPTWHS